MTLPYVSVVICTYNRYDVLNDAIASIEIQSCGSDEFELLVIDNSSDKIGQAQFLAEADISCPHRIIIEDTPGLSRARNIAVRAALGEVVAFIDDDARACVDWVAGLKTIFQASRDTAIAGGPVRPIWPSARPAWLHPWMEGFLTIIDRGDKERKLEAGEWLAGTNIAFRRNLIIEAGLFNETLGRVGKLLLSNEELSVTDKIRSLGYDMVYHPKVEVHHRVHPDRINQAWMRRRVFWQMISDLLSDGGATGNFEASVGNILDYLQTLPPKDRGLPGLFLDTDSADLFQAQTTALARLVRLMATDGQDWREFLNTAIP